jgi:hypothetical protein
MEIKEIITLAGILASLIVGGAGLYISIANSRKTIFINSITSSRIKYIQDIRNGISEYCGLFYRYKILVDESPALSNEKLEVLRFIDKLKYQLMLYLNPEDKKWDKIIIELIEDLRVRINENPESQIKELIRITQYLLKLEWEGAKLESRNGLVSERTKNRLNEKYYSLYLENRNATVGMYRDNEPR